MADLKSEFEAAVEKVRNAPEDGDFKPGNDLKLKMYALYRQASDGDVSGKRPGMLDMIGRMKFDAWAKIKGMDSDDAMRQYIATVAEIENEYG